MVPAATATEATAAGPEPPGLDRHLHRNFLVGLVTYDLQVFETNGIDVLGVGVDLQRGERAGDVWGTARGTCVNGCGAFGERSGDVCGAWGTL